MNDLVPVENFIMNKNEAKRNQILYGKAKANDAERFSSLSLDNLVKLANEKFIDPEEAQNDSPTVQEFGEFMVKHPGVTAHGYSICRERDDYRVSLEGIEFKGEVSIELMSDFVQFCNGADELVTEPNHLFAWWD